MYLTPVIVFSLWLGWRDIPVWSYLIAFTVAIGAAALYFGYASAGYAKTMGPLLGFEHKYTKLLILCVGVLVIANGAFVAGRFVGRSTSTRAPAT